MGCETADFLAEQGKEVFLVEVLPEMAAGSDGDTKAYFNLRFQQHGVRVYTSTELHRVEGKTAILRHGKDEMRIEIGTVVFAVGAVPEDGGSEEYASFAPVVHQGGRLRKAEKYLRIGPGRLRRGKKHLNYFIGSVMSPMASTAMGKFRSNTRLRTAVIMK